MIPSRRRRSRSFRWRAGFAGLLSAGLLVSPVGAADDQEGLPNASVTDTALPPPATSGANPITQAAVASGVLACAARVDQVAKFLTAGGTADNFWLFLPSVARDQHLVSTSVEVGNKEVPVAYASADFAPGMANGCGAIYESVVYWPGKCTEVAAKQFGNLRKGPNLGKFIISLDAGGGARVFLMPAGNAGCVAIKKELL